MVSGLHEREPESRAIVDALDEVVAGRGQVVVVEGPAGIGKTSLLELARDAARARNVAVASARGSDLEVAYAWGVVRQLFEPRLRGMSAAARSRTLGGAAALAAPVVLPDASAPELDADAAVGTALPAVLAVTDALGQIGKPLHFHLHDGHPLIPGLPDHFSFLTQIPIPFAHDGRSSLPSMYGPAGLAEIISAAPANASLTLEIHQAEGRLPLGDAAALFTHWRDRTNAERMNYWLAVLAQNAMLAGCR